MDRQTFYDKIYACWLGKNIGGNVAIAVWAAMQGASVVRVHDVKETVQALRVIGCLEGKEGPR